MGELGATEGSHLIPSELFLMLQFIIIIIIIIIIDLCINQHPMESHSNIKLNMEFGSPN